MPQPVRHKVKFVDRTLTQEQFAAIGTLSAEWAHTEMALALAASKFSGSDLISMFLVFSNMTAKAKIDTTGALSGSKLTDDAYTKFAGLMEAARRLSGLRNNIVHAVWLGTDRKGRMIAMEIRALYDRASVDQISWSMDEVKLASSELRQLWTDINRLLVDQRLWNGVLFE
jgi:hypothetical protein